jgi:integrase/recombinase XerD
MDMGRRRLEVDWHREASVDFNAPLRRYKRYLEDIGLRETTIDSYVGQVGRYLIYTGTDRPVSDMAVQCRETLHDRGLARSTINNYSFAIINYHRMLGETLRLPFIKRNDQLPYYFNEDDVLRIFSVVYNIKHLAMLQTIFYGCLRASEMVNLDDGDVDMKNLVIHIREGKGGRDGIAYISDECARTLREYLAMRPSIEVDGRHPLFYTDWGNRWDRRDIHRMFIYYKKRAGVEKAGGPHVFARHTAATILVANGCDLRHVQALLRHKDIRTTLRYAHVGEKTLRERYDRCLIL